MASYLLTIDLLLVFCIAKALKLNKVSLRSIPSTAEVIILLPGVCTTKYPVYWVLVVCYHFGDVLKAIQATSNTRVFRAILIFIVPFRAICVFQVLTSHFHHSVLPFLLQANVKCVIVEAFPANIVAE